VTAGALLAWLDLLGRGLHVVAGIAWIGASFYFIWLDNHLEAPADAAAAARGVSGELWAVHGGGMYHAQKYLVMAPAMPAHLHWFKWEAYTTLLSGLFLLGIVYYAHADAYLVEAGRTPLSPAGAVATSVAFLAGGWLVYDALCRSPLGRNDRVLGLVLAVLCAIAAYGLCALFPGRAAFLHFGAMLGTIMVLNVFAVIIPGQRKMVASLAAGTAPDPVHGLRGKQRSVHNTYFTLPVVFAMISNHYAFLYGATHNAAVLIGIAVAAALVRTFFVARHRGRASPLWIAGAVASLAAVGVLVSSAAPPAAVPGTQAVAGILQARCAPCHAARPTFAGFETAPKGVVLETPAQLALHAPRVREQLAARAMPLGNLTHMTEGERAALLAAVEGAR